MECLPGRKKQIVKEQTQIYFFLKEVPQPEKLNKFAELVLYKKTAWSLLLKTQKNLESGADFLKEKEEESNVREFMTQTLGTLVKKY